MCTEVDEARRRQRIRERAHAESEAARADEVELAAALRAIEEAERREAEEAERQEALRQRAETDRLERETEEARRREEQRTAAIQGRFAEMHTVLEGLHKTQHKLLDKRHEAEVRKVKDDVVSSQLARDAKWALERALAKRRYSDIREELKSERDAAVKAMETRHEEEEDDIFLAFQLHLRNKANREARQIAMVEKIKQTQLNDRNELEARYKAAMVRVQRQESAELPFVEERLMRERETERERETANARRVARKVFADWMWFDRLVNERGSMLDEHERQTVRAGQDIDSYSVRAPEEGTQRA